VLRRPVELGDGDGVRDEEEGDVWIYPKEGQLVMFPPWLIHGVPLVQQKADHYSTHDDNGRIDIDQPRVSYAFNVRGAYLGNPWDLTKIIST